MLDEKLLEESCHYFHASAAVVMVPFINRRQKEKLLKQGTKLNKTNVYVNECLIKNMHTSQDMHND